jgi:O-acetyl-ADP-ribose deacetylase (regulator of RNase III)
VKFMSEVLRTSIGKTVLILLTGDITKQATDAIVNAANSSLRGGGGVDGAIHRGGGPAIHTECEAYVRKHGPLSPGKAMATSAGNLKAQFVIHTVGPIYKNDAESSPILLSAYRESLRLAESMSIKSVSFPSISTGAYGYPLEKAARIAAATIIDYLRGGTELARVEFVCFSEVSSDAYRKAFTEMVSTL